MRKNNKKKGFTLVELIAVIAILAILAAVVVPKVTSYTTQATASVKKANASSILNAIEVYNAQATTVTITTTDTSTTTLDQILGTTGVAGALTLNDAGSSDDDLKAIINKVIGVNKGISKNTTVAQLISAVAD